MEKTKVYVYYLRYLKPKEAGLGELIDVISTTDPEFTIVKWREKLPGLFTDLGFYTLMQSTESYLTVDDNKKKK